jgi:hypothetical protein
LEEKSAQPARDKNLGEKAAWVHRFLSCVPPAHWESQWGAAPEQIVGAAPKDWRNLLHDAWWNAALRADDVRWLQAIVQSAGYTSTQQQRLFIGLSPATADTLFLWLWQTEETSGDAFVQMAQLMGAHPGPWSRELSQRFLTALQKYLAGELKKGAKPQQFFWLRHSLSSVADKFSIELAADAARGWPQQPEGADYWRPAVTAFLTRLQVRADLHNEFSRAIP